MTTESKKLQTIEGFTRGPVKIAASPDLSRLVHDQLEVIRRQDAALRAALEPLELYHAYGWPDRAGVRAKLKTEIAAATPFLEA